MRTRPFWLCNQHGQTVWEERRGSDAFPAFIKGNYFLFTLYRMSLLPSNTLANPLHSFYALASATPGPVSSLQSPVDLIPEANGDTQLNIVSSTGAGEAGLLVSSTNGNGATITISNTTGGDAVLSIGQSAVPGGTGMVSIYSPGSIVGGGQINIGNASTIGASDTMVIDTLNNDIIIGDSTTAGGLTTVQNGLLVKDVLVAGVNGVAITQLSANASGIAGSAAVPGTNTMTIGASQNLTSAITISDSGATTGQILMGGNGSTNVSINGGTVAAANVGANIRTDAASAGIMTIGSSTSNPTVMFVKDTGVANTGFVDVAGGIPPTIALRLQGANTQVGANTAQISTNNTAVNNPVLNISNSVDGTPKMVINSTGTTFNGTNTITGDTTFTTGNCVVQGILGFNFTGGSGATCGAIEGMNSYTSATVTASDGGTASIPNPTDSLGGAIEAGLYFILGRNSTSNNVPWQSVSTIGYWTGSAWVGGGGCCPALVSAPPSFLGIQGGGATLTLANGSGLGSASMIFYFRQIGGLLGMS